VASFSDAFNRANGAPGSTWTAVNSGTWAIASNALQQSDATGTYRGLRWNGGAFDSANFYARVTGRAPSGMGFGVLVRCPTTGTALTDIDGYAIVGFVGDQWYRIEFTNGSDAGYIGLGGTVTANTNYTIEVRANGSTITVYANGSQLASWTDTTYTTGGAMLVTYGGTVTFDDFEAADLATTVALTLSATGVSATADDAELVVLRALSAAAVVATTTTDAVSLNTATVFSLALAAQTATATGDTAAAAILRNVTSAATAATNTASSGALALLKALALAAQAATITTARYGVRFYGNGTGQIDRLRIEVDNPADPPIDVGAGNFCYEFWMRCAFADNTTTATDEDARYSNIILDRDIWGHERGWVLGVTRNAGNTALIACFGVAGAGLSWTTIFGTSNVGDGRWHHIALTRSTSTVRLFVDGIQEATGTYSGDLSYPNGVRPTEGQDNPYLVIGTEKHDVGFGYDGEFAEFRVSDIARYTSTFTPPQSISVDGDTAALFLFAEQTGTTAYDTSGLPGAENAALLVGGSPSGPVWTDSGAVALLLVSAITLAATPTSNTTNAAAAAILRPLVSASTAVTLTTDTVPAALLRALTFNGASATDTAQLSLTVLRAVAFNGAPVTDTAQSALAVLRALSFVATAGNTTADDIEIAILRAIASASQAGTNTGEVTLNLSAVLSLVLAAAAQTDSAEVAIAILRGVVLAAQAGTNTNDVQGSVLRLIVAGAAAGTLTNDAALAMLRAVAIGAVSGTQTSDSVALALSAIVQAILSAGIYSSTPDISMPVLRGIFATSQPGTETATPALAVLRSVIAGAVTGTLTSDAALNLATVIAAAMAAVGQTATAEGAVSVLRSLTAQALSATDTAQAGAAILRSLTAQMDAQSDDAMAALAVQRTLYHIAVAGTATNEIDFRTEVIVGLLRILVGVALRPSITASALRPFIEVEGE